MIAVSVIIPVRNESATIDGLLEDLLRQRRPAAAIFVVDTGSTDDTRERVQAFADRDPRVRLISLPSGFPGVGRNAGMRAARTEWVAFIDGGMRIDEDWLAHLMAPVDHDEGVDVVLGGHEPVAETRRQRAAALAYVPQRRETPAGGMWRGYCLPSSAVKRKRALAVGGFPEELRSGEDLVFWERLKRSSVRIAYAPKAIVRWSHAATPAQVWRRFRVYAEHALMAGRTSDWMDVIARRYALMLAAGPGFPAAAGLLLLARAWVSQRRKPELVDAKLSARGWQLLEVAFYLGLIDAATWAAWVAWVRGGRPRADVQRLSQLEDGEVPATEAQSGQ